MLRDQQVVRWRWEGLSFRSVFPYVLVLALSLQGAGSSAAETSASPELGAPNSPREFFNTGTQQLRAGKLREAEASFETAIASQNARLQPPALYNLGHVRFGQGVEELKKGPAAGPTAARSKAAEQRAGEAISSADEALAGDDVQKMVESYQRGRGARKELKAALEAVRRALAVYAATLAKWERSAGDFKSALELKGKDADARHNADVVEQCMARLVDSLREMQQCKNGMGNKETELSQKLKALKGRIPGSQMPPGAAGEEDEEEEDSPRGPEPGQKEAPSKDGKEMKLTQEQAGWLLQAFKLDAGRPLPMARPFPAKPKDRSGDTW